MNIFNLMTISALKAIIKALIMEAKLNTKPVYVYHISDNANLSFPLASGVYSQKFGKSGLFVAPLRAIRNSWSSWSANKGRYTSSQNKKEQEKREDQLFNNLTLYKLELPKWVFDKAEAEHKAKAEQGMKENPDTALGAWGWDAETFIPEEMLQHIKLAGKQTKDVGEFLKGKAENVKHRKGQKTSYEAQYKIDSSTGEIEKSVTRYDLEPTSLDSILMSRDESIKLLNKEELKNVIDKLEYFLSPDWIQDTVKRINKLRSNNEVEFNPYHREMRLSREKEAEKERSENKENAERKLSIARNLLKR